MIVSVTAVSRPVIIPSDAAESRPRVGEDVPKPSTIADAKLS